MASYFINQLAKSATQGQQGNGMGVPVSGHPLQPYQQAPTFQASSNPTGGSYPQPVYHPAPVHPQQHGYVQPASGFTPSYPHHGNSHHQQALQHSSPGMPPPSFHVNPPPSQLPTAISVDPAQFWGNMIAPGKIASPTLVLLVTSLYEYLEQCVIPVRQGGLSPEKIGVMSDMFGVPASENIYKNYQNVATMSGQGPGFIDEQIAKLYLAFSFPYVTTTRPPTLGVQHDHPPTAQPSSPFSALLGSTLSASSFLPQNQPSQMPLLSLHGLIQFVTLNILENPSKRHSYVSILLSRGQLRNPSDGSLFPTTIPRSAFPDMPDPETQQRMQQIQASIIQGNNMQSQLMAQATADSDAATRRYAQVSAKMGNVGVYDNVEYVERRKYQY